MKIISGYNADIACVYAVNLVVYCLKYLQIMKLYEYPL